MRLVGIPMRQLRESFQTPKRKRLSELKSKFTGLELGQRPSLYIFAYISSISTNFIAQFISSDGNFTGGSAPRNASIAFYNQHGFYITASDYILRPEVLESNFYAFRATGDPKYLTRARSALDSFNRVLVVNGGYAGINDVNTGNGGGFIDDTESFFFAEVLKYLYLTFDDPNHISLDHCESLNVHRLLDTG